MSGGVYGEPLLAFPEQLQDINYYDMVPAHGSGYGPPTGYQTIRGVLQNSEKRLKTGNGNIVTTNVRYLWTEDTVISGKFIRDGDGVVFRVVADNDWKLEGGFTRFVLEKVVGADGDDTLNPGMSVGTGSFA